MIDEGKLHQETARAIQAEGALNNDIIREAFATLEQSYIEAWKSTTIEDVTGREKLFLAINVVGKVKQHLQAVVNDGKLAAHQLRELAQTAEREKRWQDVQ